MSNQMKYKLAHSQKNFVDIDDSSGNSDQDQNIDENTDPIQNEVEIENENGRIYFESNNECVNCNIINDTDRIKSFSIINQSHIKLNTQNLEVGVLPSK